MDTPKDCKDGHNFYSSWGYTRAGEFVQFMVCADCGLVDGDEE